MLHYDLITLHYDVIILWCYDIITLWHNYSTLWCHSIMTLLLCTKLPKNTDVSRATGRPSKAKDGLLLSNGEHELGRRDWAFFEVLNRPELVIPAQVEDPWDSLPINTKKLMEEVRKAINTHKNNRGIWHGWNQCWNDES